MFDPDFEAGRSGGLAPPNGDWGKFFAGGLNRRGDDGTGAGCAMAAAALCGLAVLVWVFPLLIGAVSAAVIVSVLAPRGSLHRGWPASAIVFGSAALLAVAVWSICFFGTSFLAQDPAIARRLFTRESVDAWTAVSRPTAVYWLLTWGVPATAFVIAMGLARPVKSPAPLALQFGFLVLASALVLGVTAGVALGALMAAQAIGMIDAVDAAALSGGLVGGSSPSLAG